ncbi:protein CD300H-like [Prinia subflava]|uniref:protein CD300H-like n=1 Tax=Prinia subflava TaxID=208062 RepID=UPI002FE1DF00
MCVWAWLHPGGLFVKNHGENSTSGARSWIMRIFLVWTLSLMRATSTGGQGVTGPRLVMAEQGSSLAVSCSYRPRYKLSSKYWCLKNSLSLCLTYIIQTDGSEVTVTRDRVSIRDNHTANSFTVTLSSVTPGDAGRYSCGVKRRLRNRWHSIKVMVSAAVSNTTEDSNVSPWTTNPLCPRGCEEPPVLSKLIVIPVLLLISIKVPVALAVVCGAACLRSRDQESPRLSGPCTGAPGCPPVPPTPEPRGSAAVPPGPTLPGLCRPPGSPCAGAGSAPGTARPLLAAPARERGGFGVQRACVC